MGSTNSTEYMSLLNRLMIRPIGVDSKNCMVLRMIDLSILPSKTRDDRSIDITDNSSATIEHVS